MNSILFFFENLVSWFQIKPAGMKSASDFLNEKDKKWAIFLNYMYILGPFLYFSKFAFNEKYETHFFYSSLFNLSILWFFFVRMTRYKLMFFCAILKINGGPKTYLHLYYMRVFLILRLHWLLNGPWICLNDPNYNLATYRLDNSTSYIYKIHKT